jgi:hypothetical protein
MIGAGAVGEKDCTLWKSEMVRRKKKPRTIIVNMTDSEDQGMLYWRFEQFRKFVHVICQEKNKHEWWQFIAATEKINE